MVNSKSKVLIRDRSSLLLTYQHMMCEDLLASSSSYFHSHLFLQLSKFLPNNSFDDPYLHSCFFLLVEYFHAFYEMLIYGKRLFYFNYDFQALARYYYFLQFKNLFFRFEINEPLPMHFSSWVCFRPQNAMMNDTIHIENLLQLHFVQCYPLNYSFMPSPYSLMGPGFNLVCLDWSSV